jgi:GH24 family phage-related lysozyme (muramidase)
MGDSRKPGPAGNVVSGTTFPARTPGPLGKNDYGDPLLEACFGDTPGPLGKNDLADQDHFGSRLFGDADLEFDPAPMCLIDDGRAVRPGPHAPESVSADSDETDTVSEQWPAWTPPPDYADLYNLFITHEGCVSHMYLDSKGNVTVGIGQYLNGVSEATKLRFYLRKTKTEASNKEKEEEYKKVEKARPDRTKYPRGMKASYYRKFTTMDMTPTDIGELWIERLHEFERLLKHYFKGYADYPAPARQALIDIAYQYGPSGAASKLAQGKLKEAAEKGDWNAAAANCRRPEAQEERNTKTKELFEEAAKLKNEAAKAKE